MHVGQLELGKTSLHSLCLLQTQSSLIILHHLY